MDEKFKKEIFWLKVYAGLLTVTLLGTIFYVIIQTKKKALKRLP